MTSSPAPRGLSMASTGSFARRDAPLVYGLLVHVQQGHVAMAWRTQLPTGHHLTTRGSHRTLSRPCQNGGGHVTSSLAPHGLLTGTVGSYARRYACAHVWLFITYG
jgi:hypothetical protein